MKLMQQYARGIRRHNSKTASGATDEQQNGLMEARVLAVSKTQRPRNLAGPNSRRCSKGRFPVSDDWAMGRAV
jgi:hypothetical protein